MGLSDIQDDNQGDGSHNGVDECFVSMIQPQVSIRLARQMMESIRALKQGKLDEKAMTVWKAREEGSVGITRKALFTLPQADILWLPN